MYEQRVTSIPRKHYAVYSDRGNWGTSREAERVFFIFRVHRVIIFVSGINGKVKVWGACLRRM